MDREIPENLRPHLKHYYGKKYTGLSGWSARSEDLVYDCVWNDTADEDSLLCASDVAGRRRACLAAVESFVDAVDRSLAEQLLYCRCDGVVVTNVHASSSSTESRACRATMGALRPACSAVELPPPNCADVLQRCMADGSCRFVQQIFLISARLGYAFGPVCVSVRITQLRKDFDKFLHCPLSVCLSVCLCVCMCVCLCVGGSVTTIYNSKLRASRLTKLGL